MLIGVAVLAVVAIGYLFYIKYQESKLGDISFDNIETVQEDGKIYLKNKAADFSVIVSDSWIIENNKEAISFASSDYEPSEGSDLAIPKNGCWIGSAVRILDPKNDIEYQNVSSLLKDNNLQEINTERTQYKIISINGKNSLSESLIVNIKDEQGIFQTVKLLHNNKLYYFETHLFGQQKDKCQEEFYNFLQTVSIKK